MVIDETRNEMNSYSEFSNHGACSTHISLQFFVSAGHQPNHSLRRSISARPCLVGSDFCNASTTPRASLANVKTQLDVRRYISAAFRTSRISIVSIIVIVLMTKTTDTSASGNFWSLTDISMVNHGVISPCLIVLAYQQPTPRHQPPRPPRPRTRPCPRPRPRPPLLPRFGPSPRLRFCSRGKNV
jgi:hypothetical protein